MESRFAESGTRVLDWARKEAEGVPVMPAHLLLGVLLADGSDRASRALQAELDLSPSELRRRIQAELDPTLDPSMQYTRAAQKVMEAALYKAVSIEHGHVDAAHILLALCDREPDTIRRVSDLDPEALRTRVPSE